MISPLKDHSGSANLDVPIRQSIFIRTHLTALPIRYIEYETSLDEIMKLRKATSGIKANIGKGEVGCVKRCHILYDRATKKFKGDLRLWLNWLEFCRASNSPRQMSKVPSSLLGSKASDPHKQTPRLCFMLHSPHQSNVDHASPADY